MSPKEHLYASAFYASWIPPYADENLHRNSLAPGGNATIQKLQAVLVAFAGWVLKQQEAVDVV